MTLAALRLELCATILGGVIQKAEVRDCTLVLEIYAHRARHRLLCHVGDDAARVHLTTSRLGPSQLTETPLVLHLRKQIRGGRITGIVQPPYERVLRLEVTKREGGAERRRGLIIEVMGRRSNAILVDEQDVILDALRRTPPSRNPRRPILPSYPYVAPPPQERISPGSADASSAMQSRARQRDPSELLSSFLSHEIAGIGPLAGREVAYRFAGRTECTIGETSDWEGVLHTLETLLPVDAPAGGWLATRDGLVLAVAPYELTELRAQPGVELTFDSSISAAVERAFSSVPAQPSLTRPVQSMLARIARESDIEQRRAAALERELAAADRADLLRRSGEAILASLGSIQPGTSEIELDGLRVTLDPTVTPVEAAERYFADYRKARDAHTRLPALLTQVQQRLEHLETLAALVETSDSPTALRQIERDLQIVSDASPAQPPRRSKSRSAEPAPRRFRAPDGTEILVGTSPTVNDRLSFKLASPRDIWMHARGCPGAHVLVRSDGRSLDEHTLQLAADLAARFSRGRNSGTVPVDYTEARHVRKIRGAPPGLVRYVHERTLLGRPDRVEELVTVSR